MNRTGFDLVPYDVGKLTHLWGKPSNLGHGSNLSRFGASDNPGTVQSLFFKTESEIEKALSAFGQSLESVKAWERPAAVPGTVVVQTSQDVAAIHWLAAALPTWFSPAQGWLLWISQSGIFRSELWHLYYLVRTSHGDRHDIRSAPGHHFLAHESAELHSVLFLAIASGWDAHLFALGGPGRAFVSHDGWFRVDLEATIADKVMADLDDRGADYSLPGKPRMV